MEKIFYTYLILTENNTLYCGYTDNPQERFKKHLLGKAAKYTKSHKPIKMVYLKSFPSKSDAMKEEYRIKHLSRIQKEELIRSDSNILNNE